MHSWRRRVAGSRRIPIATSITSTGSRKSAEPRCCISRGFRSPVYIHTSEPHQPYLASEPYPKLTWDILSEIPNVVGIGGVALAGVYWVINRRMMMDRLRHADAADEEVVDDTYVTEDGAES